MDTSEALLRAATMLKWFRDRAITVDTEPPEDIGEMIVMLEQLAEHQRTIEMDDLELAELPVQSSREIEPTDR
jgi:hypothetical protein